MEINMTLKCLHELHSWISRYLQFEIRVLILIISTTSTTSDRVVTHHRVCTYLAWSCSIAVSLFAYMSIRWWILSVFHFSHLISKLVSVSKIIFEPSNFMIHWPKVNRSFDSLTSLRAKILSKQASYCL